MATRGTNLWAEYLNEMRVEKDVKEILHMSPADLLCDYTIWLEEKEHIQWDDLKPGNL